MRLVSCTEERHAQAILAIFNEAILNSTALYDYEPRDLEFMAGWFAAKRRDGFPVIGCEGGDGRLLGFATYGTFRAWPAYKYSVEHSIYIEREHRGQGLGGQLLGALIEAAGRQGKHTLIAGIDLENAGSIALHERFGFERAGVIRQAGFKFGRWLDLVFYQLLLNGPSNPQDG